MGESKKVSTVEYKIIDSKHRSSQKLEEELNNAAKEGYRLLFIQVCNYIMERKS